MDLKRKILFRGAWVLVAVALGWGVIDYYSQEKKIQSVKPARLELKAGAEYSVTTDLVDEARQY